MLLDMLSFFNVDGVMKNLGYKEFMPTTDNMKFLGKNFCGNLPFLCKKVIFEVCGYNDENLNSTRLPLYIYNTPAGSSVHNLMHWL